MIPFGKRVRDVLHVQALGYEYATSSTEIPLTGGHAHTRRFDDRPSPPLTKAFKRVVVTDALRRLEPGPLTITVVVATTGEPTSDQTPLLEFGGLQLTTFGEAAAQR